MRRAVFIPAMPVATSLSNLARDDSPWLLEDRYLDLARAYRNGQRRQVKEDVEDSPTKEPHEGGS